jgi:phosphate transport system permease protein
MATETGVGAHAAARERAIAPMGTGRAGDRVFAGAARGSGITVLAIVAAIAAFLVWKAVPALQDNEANFLTSETWNPNATPPEFGIAQLAFGTVISSLLAMLIATPVAIGIALFISFYSPRRLASGLGYVVDLLAAVPSIVYGLWGLAFLSQHMVGISAFLNGALGWIPLFGGDSPGKN